MGAIRAGGSSRLLARLAGCAGLIGVVALVGAPGCGPSYQAIYECDVHFEHCYALDRGGVPVGAMKECWRDWLKGYTYGQSIDRIEYGAARLSQLSLDPTLPIEDVPVRSRRTIVAPMPTSAFAPAPNMVDRRDPGDSPPVVGEASRAPGADCADRCRERWTTCHASCRDRACAACDSAYRECMPACFR